MMGNSFSMYYDVDKHNNLCSYSGLNKVEHNSHSSVGCIQWLYSKEYSMGKKRVILQWRNPANTTSVNCEHSGKLCCWQYKPLYEDMKMVLYLCIVSPPFQKQTKEKTETIIPLNYAFWKINSNSRTFYGWGVPKIVKVINTNSEILSQ